MHNPGFISLQSNSTSIHSFWHVYCAKRIFILLRCFWINCELLTVLSSYKTHNSIPLFAITSSAFTDSFEVQSNGPWITTPTLDKTRAFVCSRMHQCTDPTIYSKKKILIWSERFKNHLYHPWSYCLLFVMIGSGRKCWRLSHAHSRMSYLFWLNLKCIYSLINFSCFVPQFFEIVNWLPVANCFYG